jgi:phosphopantothenoylcysteine decarboxylase/phosphopantothenate--cysteine ligase
VMAAAVADFRAADIADHKIKNSAGGDTLTLALTRNPDVLAELAAGRRPGQIIVGFAAETGDDEGSVLEHARRKLAAKGCDLLVVNDVSRGAVFGSDRNEVTLLEAGGAERAVPPASKARIADAVWDAVAARLS